MQIPPVAEVTNIDFPSRQPLVWISLAEIAFVTIVAVSFWSAYVWPIIIAILAVVSACLSLVHFRSVADAKFNECCCSPASTPQTSMIFSAVVFALTVLGVITSIFAVTNYDNSTQIFAAICTFGLFGLCVTEAVKIYFYVRFQKEFRIWEASRISAAPVIAPITHVVSGQPIITTVQTSHYPSNWTAQYPSSHPQLYPSNQSGDVPHFVSNVQPYEGQPNYVY